ncbi:Phosphatidylinositol N-acetylglucosaminyltransferase GPI3 subunit [Vanrija albida]|uniref:1-acyl-sn-glycerol-3-phosphate acyltransferase n=1 Tax=Vanrija albida TaxID=181172 RepID=A0ABR3Q0A7_9TREE
MGAIMWKLRITVYYVLLIFTGFVATFESIIAALLGQRSNTNYYVARTFWYMAGPIIGWKFEVEGEEHLQALASKPSSERSAVLLGNHQHVVDILYLGRIFPKHAAIMAKKSLKLVPGLGTFMMLSNTVFIDRKNNKSAVQAMNEAGQEMKRKGVSLFIFPEGTRHLAAEPELLPFKKGAFYLAVQSGAPIIPIVVESYYKLLRPGHYFKRGTLKIKILPPIPTADLETTDIPKLMEQTRDAMNATLKEISTPAPKPAAEPTSPLISSKQKTYNTITDREDDEHVEEAVSSDDDNTAVETVGDEEATAAPAKDAAAAAPAKADPTTTATTDGAKLAIAMVSDFFHPDVGGVEGHIYSLSVELARRGHKVIVITNHRGERVGVRWLAPGIKVYHVPAVALTASATLPNYLLFLPYLRSILLRERITLVHGHGTLSSFAHEAMHHAPLLGIRSVFTDHSLFGFADATGVLTNKLLAGALRNADAVVCVSNTGRENTALRAELEPERVSVIPNALVPSQFEPDPGAVDPDYITIVVISRLVYRKGIDLLVASAPTICDLFPRVRFLVGGDGPKMVDLLQMREKYELQDRIELVGAVRPAQVRGILTRGQIYLNTSLTEAFGISIIEAACAGLFVVSTRVGGVPEILPSDMVEFARADEDDVIRALTHAIHTIEAGRHDPLRAHARIRRMYSWASVAERTEAVYARVLATAPRGTMARLARYASLGPVFGLILCAIMACQHALFWLCEVVYPADEVEVVEDDWDAGAFARAVEAERAAAEREES